MAVELEDIGLLIIVYDRPELLKNRVMDLANTYIPNIYISIDGGKRSHTPEMLDALEFAMHNLNCGNLNINHHIVNIGAVNHIISQITRVLSNHKYIIYLDDDIKLS
jgi:radical SAM superfamily enzyme